MIMVDLVLSPYFNVKSAIMANSPDLLQIISTTNITQSFLPTDIT